VRRAASAKSIAAEAANDVAANAASEAAKQPQNAALVGDLRPKRAAAEPATAAKQSSDGAAASRAEPTTAASAATTAVSPHGDTKAHGRTARSTAPRVDRAAASAITSAASTPASVQIEVAAFGKEVAFAATDGDATDRGNPSSSSPAIDAADATAPPSRENQHALEATGRRDPTARIGPAHRNAVRAGDAHHGESEVQRVRLVQRVARAFQTLGESGGEVRLRLSPPSLGSIKLEVTLQAGAMAARIETETATARAMLVDSLPALRERLAMHDIKVSRFDVEVAADSRQQHQPQHDEAPRGRLPRGLPRDARQAIPEVGGSVVRSHAPKSALDVLI
jgi:flagellar hook-length control protein FliK